MAELQLEEKRKPNIRYIEEEWERRLKYNSQGNVAKTIENFCVILENDSEFKDKIKLNEMSERIEYKDKPVEDISYAKMQRDIEKKYGLYEEKKFLSALKIVADQRKYNSIKIMLDNLKWDGIKRADTILSKYLGAKEDEYTAMCFRLIVFGAIERIYNPGAKFDYMLILKGGQGIGKSTFFNVLCGEKNYQENLADLKKSFEFTQGKWFVEIGELDAMKKAEATAIKTFITLRKETYRVPYEKTSRDYYRKFVLIGTTNDNDFLVDETGNRRFVVLECARHRNKLKHNVLEEGAEYEIRQALAEVFEEYKNGKKFLNVPKEFENYIEMKNKTYIMSDGMEGLVEEFLENKDRCCIMQIWDECLEPQRKWKYSKTMANRISSIIVDLPGWSRYSKSKTGKTTFSSFYTDEHGRQREKKYGKQVVFIKEKEPEKDRFKEESNENMNKIYGTKNEDYFMGV